MRGLPHRVTLIPGDGIGPEVTAAARRAVEAAGVEIDWDVQLAGAAAVADGDAPLPDSLVGSARERGVALKGPVSTPAGRGYRSVNVALREVLGLHTGIRPCRGLDGAPCAFPGVDVVVARMLPWDLYAGIEYAADDAGAAELRRLVAKTHGQRIPADAGISLKPMPRNEIERAARGALGWARANGRRRVTVVHKATVMRATDGAFLDCVRAVAEREYAELEFEDQLVDSVCHELVTRPERLDVLIAPMLYGDLLSDLCAGLAGGLGLAPGANLGDASAVFEPVHGTAPRLAGTGRANPAAMIRSAAMMLRHVGERDASERLEAAVAGVVAERRTVTYDLRPGRDPSGAAGTQEVAEAVAARLDG
jgi:isocitrate dehydrogenase (NAD+)